MLFNSVEFILAFLPFSLFVYFIVIKYADKSSLVLLLVSIFFYYLATKEYFYFLPVSVLVNYFLSLKNTRNFFLLNLIFNLGCLIYFKTKTDSFPLGISFFTFQQIAFNYNRYKNSATVENLLNYSTFVMFFPQLIAGPIVEKDEIFPQLKKKYNLSYSNLSQGIFIFSIGLFKKNILSFYLKEIAENRFSINMASSAFDSWLYLLAFTLYMYFDFSAYSDMAIGVGKMFGIELPQNFLSPFRSKNIADFWRRWHITLGRWIKNYLYIPMGGSRVGIFQNYFNLLVVFIAVGIWHGVSLNFVVFGAIHGLGVIIFKFWSKLNFIKLPFFISWFLTFTLCVFARVFYSLEDLGNSLMYIRTLFNIGNFNSRIEVISLFILGLSFLLVLMPYNSDYLYKKFKPTIINMIIVVIFLVAGILYGQKPVTFEYFRF